MHWRRKWQSTPVFLPRESQGRRSLVGCCLWGCTEWTQLKWLSSSSSTFCREPPEVCPTLTVEVALLYIYNATEVFLEHWILFMSWRKRNTVIRLESRDSTVRAKSFQSCLTVTLCTVAHQASLLMRLSRQEYCSGLPCPPPEDLPRPRTEPVSLASPALAGGFFTTDTIWGVLWLTKVTQWE